MRRWTMAALVAGLCLLCVNAQEPANAHRERVDKLYAEFKAKPSYHFKNPQLLMLSRANPADVAAAMEADLKSDDQKTKSMAFLLASWFQLPGLGEQAIAAGNDAYAYLNGAGRSEPGVGAKLVELWRAQRNRRGPSSPFLAADFDRKAVDVMYALAADERVPAEDRAVLMKAVKNHFGVLHVEDARLAKDYESLGAAFDAEYKLWQEKCRALSRFEIAWRMSADRISVLSRSSDGALLLLSVKGATGSRWSLLEATTGKERFNAASSTADYARFSPDNRWFASFSYFGGSSVFDAKTGERVLKGPGSSTGVKCVGWISNDEIGSFDTREGKFVATKVTDGTERPIELKGLEKGWELKEIRLQPGTNKCFAWFNLPEAPFATVRGLDLKTGELLTEFKPEGSAMVHFGVSEQYVTISSQDRTQWFNAETGDVVSEWTGEFPWSWDFTVAQTCGLVVSLHEPRSMRRLGVLRPEFRELDKDHLDKIESVVMGPGAGYVGVLLNTGSDEKPSSELVIYRAAGK